MALLEIKKDRMELDAAGARHGRGRLDELEHVRRHAGRLGREEDLCHGMETPLEDDRLSHWAKDGKRRVVGAQ